MHPVRKGRPIPTRSPFVPILLGVIVFVLLLGVGYKFFSHDRDEVGSEEISWFNDDEEDGNSGSDDEEKAENLAILRSLQSSYQRHVLAYQIAEDRYLESLCTWYLTALMLEARSQPFTFASEIPAHDWVAYVDLVESAEELSRSLNIYLKDWATDAEKNELASLQANANGHATMNFEGTGSRLQDAIDAMKKPRFKEVVKVTPNRGTQLLTQGKDMILNISPQVVKEAQSGYENAMSLLKSMRSVVPLSQQ